MRAVWVGLMVLGLAGTASAVEIQKRGPQIFPSKHELNAQMGFQAGFGGQISGMSGFKLTASYSYRFHPMVWFNLQASNIFGFGPGGGPCTINNGYQACDYKGGWGFEMVGGAKIKIQTRAPIIIEIPLLTGVNIMYNRECGDNGAAPIVKPGIGAKYFLTNRIGLGVMVDSAFGPGFHSSGKCKGTSYTDFFGYFDFMAGAEFVL